MPSCKRILMIIEVKKNKKKNSESKNNNFYVHISIDELSNYWFVFNFTVCKYFKTNCIKSEQRTQSFSLSLAPRGGR